MTCGFRDGLFVIDIRKSVYMYTVYTYYLYYLLYVLLSIYYILYILDIYMCVYSIHCT